MNLNLKNVINITKMTKKCAKCKKKQPAFNKEGETIALYCGDCKDPGMVNVKHKKCAKCKKKIPTFNKEGETIALYCGDCKDPDMVNVISKKCINGCGTQTRPKYKWYCLRCFIHMFPGEKVSHNYKTKEYAVVECIQKQFPDAKFVYNKRIQNGMSKRMPDLFVELKNQCIILEIDENQHRNYDCECDNNRLMELSRDVGHKNIVFIRFNPDAYFNKENKKIKSCWSTEKKSGILRVAPKEQNAWKSRLEVLCETVEYWLENDTDKMIETVQLFYDQI